MNDQATEHKPLAGRTVLQVIPALGTGGAEQTTVDIAAALVRAGARALVASEGGRLSADLNAAGGEWIRFPAATKNPYRIWRNGAALANLIRTEGVDLVHARSRAPAWSALIAARRTARPFVTTYHGTYSETNRPKNWYNSVMARGDVAIANSRYTVDLIASRYPAFKDRIEVVYRGTDLARFQESAVTDERKSALLEAWGIEGGKPMVLLPGRLTGWKGQRVLIPAAAILKGRGIKADYVLAGDAQGRTDYVGELNRRISGHGLEDAVHLVGHCADIPAAMALSNVVTIPSTEPEAFGRTAVEAQAMGRPAIVSNLGAVPETVLAPPDVPEDQRTGWRFAAGDPQALADGIAEALAMDDGARQALAARARNHAATSFGLDAMIGSTLAIYARLLNSRTP